MLHFSTRAAGRDAFRLGALLLTPVLLGGTVFLLAARVHADDAKKEDTAYTITRKYKKGEVDHYRLNIALTVGNMPITLNMLMKETTKEVKDNGNANVTDEFDEANAKIGDNESDIAALLPTLVQTRDKMGLALDTKLEGGSPLFTSGPSAKMFNNLQQSGFYPDKPVKVGDTWKIAFGDKAKDGQKTTGTATFVAMETIDGTPTLKIKTSTDVEGTFENPMTGEKSDVKTHAEGISNIDPVTGKALKVKVTTEGLGSAAGGQPGKGEFTMLLVKPDAKDKDAKDKKSDAVKKDK